MLLLNGYVPGTLTKSSTYDNMSVADRFGGRQDGRHYRWKAWFMVRQTLQREVLDTIGEQIVGGVLRPGQVLRTEDLEGAHEASRTVVRETLKVLESMRLVAVRRRIGVTVLEPSEWNVFDPRVIRWRLDCADREAQLRSLTELRYAIEPVAARCAALNATSGQRDQLLGLSEQLQESGRPRQEITHLQRDVAFHSLLLRASGNEMFAALVDPITAVLSGRIAHHRMPADPTPQSLDLHSAVARAVAAGNSDEAQTAMRQIVSEVREQIMASDAGQ